VHHRGAQTISLRQGSGMSCVFCHIVAGKSESDVLYLDEMITAGRDLRAQAPTHTLVVPDERVSTAKELLDRDSSALVRMFSKAHALAEAVRSGKGYRLVINTGSAAGQIIDHLYLHLLGGESTQAGGMALRWKDGMT
jgi:histidine triad (HIT) family protein